MRPDAVVMELTFGEKACTFSGMWVRWEGMSDLSGLRVSIFCLRPAPTSVQPG